MTKNIDGQFIIIIILLVITVKMFISNKNTVEMYDEMLELDGEINWGNWGFVYREKILSKDTDCLELNKMLSEIEDLEYVGLAPIDSNSLKIYINNFLKIRDCQ